MPSVPRHGPRSSESKAEQATQARDRIEREAQTTLQQRTKRLQDLEQALEAANAARTRAEKDLGLRAQQAEAKAQDLVQKLATGLRVQKDLEARLQKEGAEQSQRLKGELERREAQRQQEVARLQQALQEKSKQVKVMELELQRLKQRAGPSPSPSSNLPRPSSPNRLLAGDPQSSTAVSAEPGRGLGDFVGGEPLRQRRSCSSRTWLR